MKCAIALLLLGAVAVSAQVQVCDPKLKPGQVSSSSIKMVSTKYTSGYSDLTVEWPRPIDRQTSAGLNSCIASYDVTVFRASDGKQLQSASVSVSPAHDKASYRAPGLSAGDKYQVAVTPVDNNGRKGSTGMKSQPMTTAAKPPTGTAVPI